VQTYVDPAFLVEAVFVYLNAGLRQNESIALAAIPSNLRAFEDKLKKGGWNVAALKEKGQIVTIDPSAVLSRCMAGNKMNGANARAILSDVLEKARCGGAYRKTRVYGEIVNVLWQQGHSKAAIQLEQIWNDLLQNDAFSLFCAYPFDPLDQHLYSGFLRDMCDEHSVLIPFGDYAQFEASVNRAIREILGRPLAGMLETLIEREQNATSLLPQAQSDLFWLKQNMPATWRRILTRTAYYYSSRKNASREGSA